MNQKRDWSRFEEKSFLEGLGFKYVGELLERFPQLKLEEDELLEFSREVGKQAYRVGSMELNTTQWSGFPERLRNETENEIVHFYTSYMEVIQGHKKNLGEVFEELRPDVGNEVASFLPHMRFLLTDESESFGCLVKLLDKVKLSPEEAVNVGEIAKEHPKMITKKRWSGSEEFLQQVKILVRYVKSEPEAEDLIYLSEAFGGEVIQWVQLRLLQVRKAVSRPAVTRLWKIGVQHTLNGPVQAYVDSIPFIWKQMKRESEMTPSERQTVNDNREFFQVQLREGSRDILRYELEKGDMFWFEELDFKTGLRDMKLVMEHASSYTQRLALAEFLANVEYREVPDLLQFVDENMERKKFLEVVEGVPETLPKERFVDGFYRIEVELGLQPHINPEFLRNEVTRYKRYLQAVPLESYLDILFEMPSQLKRGMIAGGDRNYGGKEMYTGNGGLSRMSRPKEKIFFELAESGISDEKKERFLSEALDYYFEREPREYGILIGLLFRLADKFSFLSKNELGEVLAGLDIDNGISPLVNKRAFLSFITKYGDAEQRKNVEHEILLDELENADTFDIQETQLWERLTPYLRKGDGEVQRLALERFQKVTTFFREESKWVIAEVVFDPEIIWAKGVQEALQDAKKKLREEIQPSAEKVATMQTMINEGEMHSDYKKNQKAV